MTSQIRSTRAPFEGTSTMDAVTSSEVYSCKLCSSLLRFLSL